MENIFNSGMMVSGTQHLPTIIRKSLISVFQDFFASINKAFGLVGMGDGRGGGRRWAIILWGLDTFLMFPNFLRS